MSRANKLNKGRDIATTVTLAFCRLDLSILAPEIEQRLALPHHHFLNFRNEDGVVTRILRGVQTTFQISQRVVQHRGAVGGAVETGASFLFSVMRGRRGTGVVLGYRPLTRRQHVYPKALAGVQVGVRSGLVVNANQHQQRIERHGGKGVRGHAMHLAFVVHGDDRDPGSEAAQGFAEVGLRDTHCGSEVDLNSIRRWRKGWRIQLLHRVGGNPLESTEVLNLAAGITTRVEDPAREIDNTRLPLSRETAYRLIRCSDGQLPELLAAAVEAKQRFKPGVITYSRKVFLPLTNLCRDYCGYCIFRRDPGQPGAHTMTPEEVLEVARAGEKLGCTEALFSLGDKPELTFAEMRETLRRLGYNSTLHYLEAMCELVLRETRLLPHPNPGLLSAEWIGRLAAVSPSMGLMLETTNASLLAAGAAHDNAPDKVPARRLRVIEEAGKQQVPFTTGLLIGIGETPEDRVDSLLAIRDLHRRYGHIQEVIIQTFRVKPEIPMNAWPEPTQGDMLRTIAVARLLMPEVNLQAPPNLSAPNYEDLLDAGINDWGGVSPLTPDFINPERPWPHLDELQRRTQSKGFVLRQRLPVYPEFFPPVTTRPGLLAERVLAAADPDRYARRAA